MFPRFWLTIIIALDNGLVPTRRQTSIWNQLWLADGITRPEWVKIIGILIRVRSGMTHLFTTSPLATEEKI